MAEFPALPLWTDAYLGDTNHLNVTEHGAYLLLLITLWRSKTQELPDDNRLLARYARCTTQQWEKLRPILEPFFVIENGLWIQGRLSDEWASVKKNSRRQSDKAKSRWLINKESPKPRQCRNDASLTLPNPIYIDTNVSIYFERLWNDWKPFDMTKGAKGKALISYQKAIKETDHETIYRSAVIYIENCHKLRSKTKHLVSWLNGRCYNDEPEIANPVRPNDDSSLRDRVDRTARKIDSLVGNDPF